MPPTVGSVGLANPSAPVNYATMQYGARFGYGVPATAGAVMQTTDAGLFGGGLTTWLLLGAVAVAAWYLLK